ncbi:MAG: nucleotide exchange factor GrpE [Verrucomicrobiota bacterium]
MSSETQKPIDEEASTAPAVEETPTDEATDASGAAVVDESDTGALLEQIEKLQIELNEQKERNLRSVADLDNFRRRVAREKDDLRKRVEADVIEDLLPAMDNFQIGLEHAAKAQSGADVAKGFEFIVTQIQGILEQRGLTQVAPKVGDEFNHHQHDAVGHEVSDEIPDHHILKVMRAGYQLKDRLLRPASVTVSSGPANNADNAESTDEKPADS